MRRAGSVLIGFAMTLAVACGGKDSEGSGGSSAPDAAAPASPPAAAAPAATADSSAAKEQAEQIFAGRCFTCHGSKGEGNGPGSAALMPKPRNFTDATWQASVTDDHIAKIIQFGGAAVGKSPTMPGNPDLMSKPEVVAALVAHIRSLGAPH